MSLWLFVTGLTLGQLQNHAKVETWSPSNTGGYQRPLVERRLREVARYIQEEQGILPTSILVGTRPGDEPALEAEGFSDDGQTVASGWLVVPDGARLWVVDGQHRLYGADYAFNRGAEELAAYTFPVSIMWDIDRYTEMVHFNIINTRQKKMPTDIVDRHLLQMQQVQGLKMVSDGARGEKEYLRASAVSLVDRLNDEAGVWQHQIAIPGVPGRDSGLIRQHAMVVSIEPFLKDPWVKGRKEDDQLKVLVNFWAAAEEVWPEAFASPKDYRVQATVGVYSLHMVLPVLIQRCLDERDLTKSKMKELLQATGITSQFWHKEDGDPYTLGTGMASIRALAHYITDQLPKGAAAGVKI